MTQSSTKKTGMVGALRAKSCAEFLVIGESTWWKWVKENRVPQGKRLSPRCTVWRLEDLQSLLSDKPQ